MRKTNYLLLTIGLALFVLTASANTDNGLTINYQRNGFALFSNGIATPVILDKDDHEVVSTAAKAFAEDIEQVAGTRPALQYERPKKSAIIIGTLGRCALIDSLASVGVLDTKDIAGKWETFCLTTITVQGNQCLVIYGSDPRGTAYGVFELSRAMGVTPYVWWADVTPEHHEQLFVQTTGRVVGPPSVKYRGLFINDEDWGLQPWAAKNMDTDVADIGPKTYEKVCELLLRLKGNYLWPAMHPCTKAFWYYKQNPEVARRYAIVLGSSHCEPLLRNNVDEWSNNFTSEYGKASGDWNWNTNSATITQYWTDRVKESKDNDAIYTMGMRGIHDSGLLGYSTNSAKQAALKEIIAAQRNILSTNLEKDADKIPQMFCPYKEALTLYKMGLDLPDDITLLWPDDNFGYIRQLSNESEQQRTGGGGVYYHFSYWGVPCDHLWLSSVSPTLTSYELQKAYDMNCKNIWIYNVGDIKPQEAELQFGMDFAWDVNKWGPLNAYNYTEQWANEYFGENLGSQIAAVKNEYYRLAAAGKPEHVHAITYTRAEVEQRLTDYQQLEQNVEALTGSIPSRLQDAFFELIYYPIVAAANMNKKELYAKMSFYAAEEGSKPKTQDYANKAMQAYERIVTLTNQYNKTTANGKWDGIMDYAPRALSYFYEPTVATTSNVVDTPVPADNSTETKVLSASDYSASAGSSNIHVIQGLGISGKSVTVMPLNMTAYTESDITSAPYLDYDIPVGIGTNKVVIKCLPNFPINPNYKLRFATQVDCETPVFHDITLVAEASPWSTNVMTGYSSGSISIESTVDGTKKVRLYLADPGVTVSQIEVTKPVAGATTVEGLLNAGFEYKSEGVLNNGSVTRGIPYGWTSVGTLKGNSFGISSDATGYEGSSICWINSTPMPETYELSQTLTGLKAGRYLVRCKLGVFSGTVTNQRLFANNCVEYYGSESSYVKNLVEGEENTFAGHAWGVKGGSKGQLYEMAVYVTLAEGEDLKVGIRSSNKKSDGTTATDNSGWFKVDDFRISYLGEEETPLTPEGTDDTYTNMMANPNFEYISETDAYESGTTRGIPYGWQSEGSLVGNSYGINADGTNYDGNALCWINSTPMPQSFRLYQSVSGVPAGHYTMTCKMANFTGLVTNQRVFANRYVQYFGRQEDYEQNLSRQEYPTWANNTATSSSLLKPMSLDFYLFPGEDLTLGVKSSNTKGDGSSATSDNSGWFKIDNFELQFVENDTQDYLDHVNNLAAEADALVGEAMNAGARSTLQNATANAAVLTTESDMAAIQVATNNLIDALADARISMAQYQKVSKALKEADEQTAGLLMWDEDSYNAVTSPIQSALNDGSLDFSQDYATRIGEAVIVAIKSQQQSGADMTGAVKNADCVSLDGWTVTGADGNKAELNTWSTEGNSDLTNMRTPFIEDWINGTSSTPLSDATITTTVDGLHAGLYRITALIRAYQEYSTSDAITGVYLTANQDAASATDGTSCYYGSKVGVYGTYEVLTTLSEDGSITFGISVKDATVNWVAMKNFTLTYVGNSLLLDENSSEAPAEGRYHQVVLKRAMKANTWSTLCLPFNLNKADGWKVEHLAGTETDGGNINMVFDEVNAMTAGVPYMVRPDADVTEIEASDVDVISTPTALTAGSISMNGNYTMQYVPQGSFFINSDIFYLTDVANTVSLKGYRAYFTPADPSVKSLSMTFDMEDGIHATHEGIGSDETVAPIYDLSGRKVVKAVRGVFIQNGRVMVK